MSLSPMDVQPLRSFPPFVNGKGSEAQRRTVKMGESNGEPPSINLRLGIGSSLPQNPVIKQWKPAFTPVQLQELQQQALIFRYIAAGLRVPLSLLNPIWKSVASSLALAHGGVCKQYSSFVGFGPHGLDLEVDPEPGRCRRTDGKKWRCSKNAVPDQKYCQQHMHRGRNRSRKPVEPPPGPTPGTTQLPNDSNKNSSENSKTPSNTIKFEIMTSGCECAAAVASGSNCLGGNRNTIASMVATCKDTDALTTNTENNNDNRNNPSISKKDEQSLCVIHTNVFNRSRKRRNEVLLGNRMSPGLGFSPKSVLQDRRGSDIYRNETEAEPGRCRRTDGKKWRCKGSVVPHQKYCIRHMHRGVKKLGGASNRAADPYVSDSRPLRRLAIPKKPDSGMPGTNLSISIASPGRLTNDEKSLSSSCSSDATISDTTVTA